MWATKATVALGAAKHALTAGRGVPLTEAMGIEQEAFQRTFASEDAREGIDAFVEKREPRFTGR
jgi:enoyl-CoA hydratase/carnithine racemase